MRAWQRLSSILVAGAVVLACAVSSAAAKTQVQFQPIHVFDEASEGAPPFVLLEAEGGQVYGLASSGGPYGGGTFFTMAADGEVTVLHAFDAAVDGVAGLSGAIQGSDGNFYATASHSVVQLTPAGTVTIVHTFSDGVSYPSHLIQGPDGNMYGIATFDDGIHFGGGSVFRLTLAGSVTLLRSSPLGFDSFTELMLGQDQNLYGATYPGEAGSMVGGPTVYRLTLSGQITTLHALSVFHLIDGEDGALYGFGAEDVYRMTPDGMVTTLSTLRNVSINSVIRARDGQFYGTMTQYTPAVPVARQNGALFKMTVDGTVTALQSADEDDSFSTLIELDDGRFSGVRVSATAASPSVAFAMQATVTPSPAGDVDGDAKSDVTVFRPSTGIWYVQLSSLGSGGYLARQWGQATDVPVPGDYDGDGRMDVAVYRPSSGVWYVLKSSSGFASYTAPQWGGTGDIPVPGDYDGDGRTDPAVFRPATGTWSILFSRASYTTHRDLTWGLATDIVVPGDYDGDGKTDLGVFRPSTGMWYVLLSRTNYSTYIAQAWGLSTDIPVPGDYDGDGKNDLALYRPSTGSWQISLSSTEYATSIARAWGLSTDIAVPGDYDGDGRTDLGIFRPSTGVWYVLLSATNFSTSISRQWGEEGDIPLP